MRTLNEFVDNTATTLVYFRLDGIDQRHTAEKLVALVAFILFTQEKRQKDFALKVFKRIAELRSANTSKGLEDNEAP